MRFLAQKFIHKGNLKMSICDSGIESKVYGGKLLVEVSGKHPLILLAQIIPWKEMFDLILDDLKKSTAKGQWWRGRKLKIRTHLGAYILQQLNNLTDRKTESEIKENAANQIFCGREIVKGWKAPDHTKIATFRSRLTPITQQRIANMTSQCAVKIGIADASKIDIDSTVQEANITYPTDAKMLRKLGSIAAKVCNKLNEVIPGNESLSVDLKMIASKARNYFFREKSTTSKEKYALLSELLDVVSGPVNKVVSACKALPENSMKKFKWNIKRSIHQLISHGESYLASVQFFINTGKAKKTKRLSFHADEVSCFSKGKVGKPYEFGRSFQIGRLDGNILYIGKSDKTIMHDKSGLQLMLEEHELLFGKNKMDSLATDKGYYSERNIRRALKKNISEIGIQIPRNTKLKNVGLSDEANQRLRNRRAGIEPLIGHLKRGGQMGKTRMKNDQNVEASAYTSVLGFNLRQIMKILVTRDKEESMAF